MIPHFQLITRDEDVSAVQEVMLSGQLGQGPVVRELEKAFAARFRPGPAFDACCVNSGTAALYLGLLQMKPSELEIPVFECSSLFNASAELVGTHFVDLDSERSNGPRIITYPFGHDRRTPFRSGDIEDFTRRPGWLGTGCNGFFSVCSFGPTKPLGAAGGGVILGEKNFIDQVRDRRDYDQKPSFRKMRLNWQMSDLQAAPVLSKLRRIEWEAVELQKLAERLYRLPMCSGKALKYTQEPEVALQKLAAFGVRAIRPVLPQELLHRWTHWAESFPRAERFAATAVSLPLWLGMTFDDEQRILEVMDKQEVQDLWNA